MEDNTNTEKLLLDLVLKAAAIQSLLLEKKIFTQQELDNAIVTAMFKLKEVIDQNNKQEAK